MFTLVDQRYKLDGPALMRARLEKNLTLTKFAEACAWSPAYQWKLEGHEIESISEATKNVIEDVLKSFN